MLFDRKPKGRDAKRSTVLRVLVVPCPYPSSEELLSLNRGFIAEFPITFEEQPDDR